MKILQNRWALLAILSLTWGSSFILIKKSLLEFDPVQVGAFRVTLAGLALLFIGLPALRKMSRRTIAWMLLAGFFGNFLPMFLFPIAQTRVSSSLAGILDTLVPLFVLLFGWLFFSLRSTTLQFVGALIGFLGASLLMLASNPQVGESHLGYAMLVVLATAAYAIASLIINTKLGHVKSLELSGAIFALWLLPALVALVVSGFFSDFTGTVGQWQGVGYMAVLSLIGTAVAVGLFYKLIQLSSAVFAGTVTFLLPVVSTIWGIVDGEQFTVWYPLGGILIFVGIYLIREKKPA